METFMASAEREPITGVWGQSPQRGTGEEPLVRGSESWQHFSVWTLEESGKFASLSVFCTVNCTMMSSTLCFWTAQFLILDCTNCILDCTNWLDCTLRISPVFTYLHALHGKSISATDHIDHNHIDHKTYDEFITLNYYFITCRRVIHTSMSRVVFIFLPLSVVIRRQLAYSLSYSISHMSATRRR